MVKLNANEIGQRLTAFPGWEYKQGAIEKLFRFKRFLEGIELIDRVARIAEASDHHPDIHVNYTRIRFICTTHSEGGVTERDFKLAREIEDAFQSSRA